MFHSSVWWMTSLVLSSSLGLISSGLAARQNAAARIPLSSLDAFNTKICGRILAKSMRIQHRDDGPKSMRIRNQLEPLESLEDWNRNVNGTESFVGNRRLTLHSPTWRRKLESEANVPFAEPGEVPWYVSLQTYFIVKGDRRRPRCAGTLIHNNIVLTGAHCLRRSKYLATTQSYAIVGLHDWHKNITHKRVPIKRICLPKDYTPQWSRNHTRLGKDFALVELAEPVKYNQHVQPACMYDLKACRDVSKKRYCMAVGLGHQLMSYRPGKLSAVPMRRCLLGELKPLRSDELCFRELETKPNQLDLVDRGSGIYCGNLQTNRTYVVGTSTIPIQPIESICCQDKPEQTYYTDLFRWRAQLAQMFDECLGIR